MRRQFQQHTGRSARTSWGISALYEKLSTDKHYHVWSRGEPQACQDVGLHAAKGMRQASTVGVGATRARVHPCDDLFALCTVTTRGAVVHTRDRGSVLDNTCTFPPVQSSLFLLESLTSSPPILLLQRKKAKDREQAICLEHVQLLSWHAASSKYTLLFKRILLKAKRRGDSRHSSY